MRKIIAATFTALLVSAGMASAQDLYEHHLNHLDDNKDGALTRVEYEDFMNSAFRALDTNKDGSLSVEEASKVLTQEQIRAVDTNQNGRISRQEFMRQVMKDFDAADKDGDGSLR
ncbi:EF-hand domain-containing protein [bacterium SGD-2]|jgi:Ca2+-binding protein (EF-Hand superfamily)|nr:EF-hand domain-containing protein [bacterium SGD-2]